MMKQGIVAGVILILAGVGLFAYYENFVRYERESTQLLTEGKLIYERGSDEAINDAISIFSKVVARYPGTAAEAEAYYFIAQGYEKLNLNRLAYLKYVYIIKNNRKVDRGLAGEVRARIARLKTKKRYTEEGVHELLGLLSQSTNRDFRSRVYTELGHTYLQTRELERSKRMFDLALSENGDNEEAILGKARAYKHLGQDDMAYDLYEYYLRYYGNFSNYADDVARAYVDQVYRSGHERYRKGNYHGAIAFFNRLLRHSPESPRTLDSLFWIGQSNFAMKKYGTAITYYDRVLAHGGGSKGEDARIKKGYAYFLMKNFDLAAREFQLYLNAYPRGRFADTARKWKGMSTKEILYRVQNRMITDLEIDGEAKRDGSGKGSERPATMEADRDPADRAMTGGEDGSRFEDIEFENVGEL